MVVRIAKWRGVGDHDTGITVAPERPLIRPAHAGNERGKRGAFGWNLCILTKERDDAMKECPRRKVADESYEVADFGIKNTKARRWISLRSRRIGKIADRFKTDHGRDFVAARLASAGVNKAAHFIR